MTKVRLEIDEVQIHRPRKRWKLYFIVLTEHPSEKDKMIVSTLPQNAFKLSKRHDNSYQFDTNDKGSEGLFVLSRDLPESREINVHIYLRHTRKAVRDLGDILSNIDTALGKHSLGKISNMVGTTATPWLVIAKKAVPLLGKIFAKIPDKDFGFVSAYEQFGDEFEETHEVDRKKDFTGDASLIYSWSIDE